MVNGASTELLRDLLETYEMELASAGAPVAAHLQPGADEEVIVSKLASVGLLAPAELVAWFSWHDGYRTDSPDPIGRVLPFFAPASLDQAISRYRSLVLENARSRSLWPPDLDERHLEWGAGEGWLRIADDSEGIAIECRELNSPPRTRYANPMFWVAGNESFFRARSLCTSVAYWLDCLRSGGLSWDHENFRWSADFSVLPPAASLSILA